MPIKKKKVIKRKTIKKKSGGSGVGLAALAVATAAGAYFLYGNKDKIEASNKKIKGWMLQAKGEVLEKIETMKHVDEKDYKEIVDTVSKKYKKLKTVSTKEMTLLMKELKDHWKHIHKDIHDSKDK